MTDIETLKSLRESFKPLGYAHQRWATEEEVEVLYNLTKSHSVKRVVEIGTANGYTAAAFALAGAEVLTFDIADRPKMYLDKAFPFPEIVKQIKFQNVPSPQCVELVPLFSGQTLYFIDADHTYTGVKRDFDAVMTIIRRGDIVAQHDTIGEVGSRRVWNETVAMGRGTCQLHQTRNGIGVAFIEV